MILSDGSLWSPNLIEDEVQDDVLKRAGFVFIYRGGYRIYLTEPGTGDIVPDDCVEPV